MGCFGSLGILYPSSGLMSNRCSIWIAPVSLDRLDQLVLPSVTGMILSATVTGKFP